MIDQEKYYCLLENEDTTNYLETIRALPDLFKFPVTKCRFGSDPRVIYKEQHFNEVKSPLDCWGYESSVFTFCSSWLPFDFVQHLGFSFLRMRTNKDFLFLRYPEDSE